MTDEGEAEVERLAEILFDASLTHWRGIFGYLQNNRWKNMKDLPTRDNYLAMARAALAELCPAPVVVQGQGGGV